MKSEIESILEERKAYRKCHPQPLTCQRNVQNMLLIPDIDIYKTV